MLKKNHQDKHIHTFVRILLAHWLTNCYWNYNWNVFGGSIVLTYRSISIACVTLKDIDFFKVNLLKNKSLMYTEHEKVQRLWQTHELCCLKVHSKTLKITSYEFLRTYRKRPTVLPLLENKLTEKIHTLQKWLIWSKESIN